MNAYRRWFRCERGGQYGLRSRLAYGVSCGCRLVYHLLLPILPRPKVSKRASDASYWLQVGPRVSDSEWTSPTTNIGAAVYLQLYKRRGIGGKVLKSIAGIERNKQRVLGVSPTTNAFLSCDENDMRQ